MTRLDDERRDGARRARGGGEPTLVRAERHAAVPFDEDGRALERHHAAGRAEHEHGGGRRGTVEGNDPEQGERLDAEEQR